jgi:hypothetical protein
MQVKQEIVPIVKDLVLHVTPEIDLNVYRVKEELILVEAHAEGNVLKAILVIDLLLHAINVQKDV